MKKRLTILFKVLNVGLSVRIDIDALHFQPSFSSF